MPVIIYKPFNFVYETCFMGVQTENKSKREELFERRKETNILSSLTYLLFVICYLLFTTDKYLFE